MNSISVSPCSRISGEVAVPGDKSVSHRAAIISALASGESAICGFLESEDCLNTLKILEQLGAGVSRRDGAIYVAGCSGKLKAPLGDLDCGNSGTGMRLLAGVLAGQPFESTLTGDASLSSRPMKRISDPLKLMGAAVSLTGEKGTAPVTIKGGALKGITYEPPMASAQVKSCVLLAGLFADGDTIVVEKKPTRDHTEIMLADAGADLRVDGLTVVLKQGGAWKLQAREWTVPCDFSSAAFWLVAAASCEGAALRINNIGLNPKRTALIGVLKRMGADIDISVTSRTGSELAGDIKIKGRQLVGAEVGGDEIPNLVDEVPILAVAATLARGRTVIRDARELRVKESDRLAAMAQCLVSAGGAVQETEDGLIIDGAGGLKGGCDVDSRGDHRIAMAMAIAGLCSADGVRVNDVDCILTSYPSFWSDMDKVAEGCCA